MMKRRSKPAISRVRLDGRSKDERYRTDNSRARARARTPRVSCRCSFRANLSSPALSDRSAREGGGGSRAIASYVRVYCQMRGPK